MEVIATKSCTAAIRAAVACLQDRGAFEKGDFGCIAPELTYPGTYSFISEHPDNGVGDVDMEGRAIEQPFVNVELWGRPDSQTCYVLDAAHNVLRPRHGSLLRRDIVAAVCYSFGPTKEINAPCGGAVVVNEKADEFACELRRYLNNSHQDRGPSSLDEWSGGIKGLMPDPIAAMVREHMRSEIHNKRKIKRHSVLGAYDAVLGDKLLTKPKACSGHLAVVRFDTEEERDEARARLDEEKVEWSHHYRVEGYNAGAAELSSRVLTIPCHQFVSTDAAGYIAKVVLG